MKNLIIFLSLLLPALSFAQFPPPGNFEFEYEYIYVNTMGFCEGVQVEGPAYCSHFWWETPDTSGIQSSLDHYKLYYLPLGTEDTTLWASPVNSPYEESMGFLGTLWVTACYANPEGESPPSNVVINEDLPISAVGEKEEIQLKIYYTPQTQLLHVENSRGLVQLQILDLQGRCWLSKFILAETISLSTLPTGMYMVWLVDKKGRKIMEKILL
jgi:hypothetical protein